MSTPDPEALGSGDTQFSVAHHSNPPGASNPFHPRLINIPMRSTHHHAALLALVPLMLTACAETPSTPPSAGAVDGGTQGEAVATAPSEARTCQTDGDTGSHLRKKTVCLTAEQEREQRQALEQGRSYRSRSAGGGSAGQ